MTFTTREITVHLMGKGGPMGPCHPASPAGTATERPGGGCKGRTEHGGPKTRPEDGKDPEGKKERNLGLLQALLREALAPPPL